jgi:glucose/arabinose dehydrogenase
MPRSIGRLLAVALSAACCTLAGAQTLRTQTVATGLNQPVGVYAPPGDTTRLFIVEQNGLIRILDLATNTVNPTPFLNISSTGLNLTAASGERGLLGMAFDPNFATNGRFYIYYTTLGSPFNSRVDRFVVNGTPSTSTTANTGTRLTMLQFTQDFSNHNGGALVFSTDGMLYVGSGDGGGANDPNERAVNLDSPLGKLLRLDVNDSSAADGDGLWVPNDNPFPTGAGFRPYIWAYGLRNPWRVTVDRANGDLYIADVGQDAREEINWQPALTPANLASVRLRHYGWDCREGFIAATATDQGCNPAAGVYTDPIEDYTHGAPDNACSVTGGHVYRGSAIPELVGAYLVADYCGNWVRSFRNNNGVISDVRDWTSQLNTGGTVNGLVAINEDGAGELYLVSINLGRVDKIVPLSTATCNSGACPAPVNALATVFQDTFDTALAWTVSGAASDGAWQRGVPVTSPSYAFNPPFAAGGTGSAFVTDNTDPGTGTTSDVDGGSTVLTSPAINGSRGQLTICFDYFLSLTEQNASDGLFVDVSANGTTGPWTRVASFTALPSGGCIWTSHSITTSQLAAAGVTNQADIRVRFTATDAGTATVIEAGVDNVRVQTANPPPDCNGNGVADSADIAASTSLDLNANSIPDECDISASIAAAILQNNPGLRIDLDGGPVGTRLVGAALYNNTCFGCHGANGAGGTPGPNIRNRDRVFIRERIVFNRPALHPGGGFTAFTPQNFADLEAFLADGGSRGRPDGVIDQFQMLSDCDNDTVSDGRELELGTQVDAGYDGIPDTCQCPADINGDGLNIDDIFIFLNLWFAGDVRADFNGLDGVNIDDIFIYLNAWFAGC